MIEEFDGSFLIRAFLIERELRSERVNFWYAGKYHWTVKRVAEFLRFRTLELSR